jgi:hypothetical protein
MASIFSFLQGGVSPFRTLLNTVRPLVIPPIKLGGITVANVVTPPVTRLFDATSNVLPTAFADARSGNATAFANSSILRTYGTNVSRIEIDPATTSILGLLVEPAAATVIENNDNQTAVVWGTNNLSGITRNVTAPDGLANSATTITPSATSGVAHSIYTGPNNPTTGGAYRTASAYVKAGGRRYVYILMWGSDATGWVNGVFDIGGTADGSATQTQVGATGTLVGTASKYLGNGWYRISITQITSASNTYSGLSFGICDAATGNAGTADYTSTTTSADTVIVWGIQNENSQTATSFIYNTGTSTSVSRAADAISFTLGASTSALQFTFDDGSTQTVTGLTPSSTYTIPTDLNRAHILYIDDVTSASVNAAVAQTLGALVTAATDTVLVQASIAQTLGVLGQAAPATALDQTTVAQTLGALSQAATATAPVTWNPSDKDTNIVLSNGNLTASLTASIGALTGVDARATNTFASGYWEVTFTTLVTGQAHGVGIGFSNSSQVLDHYPQGPNSIGYFYNGFVAKVSGSTTVTGFAQGDVVGAWLVGDGSLQYFVNGVNVYTDTTIPAGNLYPIVCLANNTESGTANFGATAMSYLPYGVLSWDQSQTGTDKIKVAQALGSLGQTTTATAPVALTIAQNLGALTQSVAATHPDTAAVAQTLGGLGQTATGGVIDTAAAAQTLGAIVQAATSGVVDAATAAQTLGALAQATTATAPVAATAAQTLGALGQAAADTNLDHAVVDQTLGALGQAAAATHPDSAVVAQNLGALTQAATGGVVDTAAAAQTLGAIVQTATAGAVDTATAAQTLGALAQAATATAPLAVAASQTLGALAQAATGTVSDAGLVAQTLGALVQSTGATVIDNAAVAQTLGALAQAVAVTVVSPSSLSATQTLGDLGQALTGVAVDSSTVAQSLGSLGQSVAATHADTASVAQTLGAIVQATTGAVIDTAVVSQALGALNQTATATTTTGFQAAQTLGGIVQALTGKTIDAATVAQALGGLGQTAAGGVVATFPARTDSLPALTQTATGVHVSFANVAQVLGALSQIATAQGPGSADFLASQILGGLQQVATSTAPERALAAQVLGALGQSVRLAIAPPTKVRISGSIPILPHIAAGSLSKGRVMGGSLRTGRAAISGSLKKRPLSQ